MCFVVTCWKRADLLALVCGVYCEFVTFPIGILGQVWYLIVSIPDLCTLTYFGSKLYKQIVGIPTDTNCAPLAADLFLSVTRETSCCLFLTIIKQML